MPWPRMGGAGYINSDQTERPYGHFPWSRPRAHSAAVGPLCRVTHEPNQTSVRTLSLVTPARSSAAVGPLCRVTHDQTERPYGHFPWSPPRVCSAAVGPL